MKNEPEIELELLTELRHERFQPHEHAPDLEERIMTSYREKKCYPLIGRRSVGSLLALIVISGIGLAAGAVGVMSLVEGWNIWVDPIDADTQTVLDAMADSEDGTSEVILPNGETRKTDSNVEGFELRTLGYAGPPYEDPK